VRRDGMLPFMIKRLKHYESQISEQGHRIRFAVSRGPLNIATFLLGGTEFLLGIKIESGAVHRLLETVSEFIVEWLQVQKESFPTIEGCFILDDIVGFVGEEDFKEFAYPYLRQIFGAMDVPVKFFHNDAPALASAPYLPEIGINMFNFSFEHGLGEMKELTKNRVTLVGNIPPRDILDRGSPEQIRGWVRTHIAGLREKDHLIASCGGGLSPGTSDDNFRAFVLAVREAVT